MGRPKGLLPVQGRPLLVHHVEAFGKRAERVIVVLGSQAEAHRAVLPEGVATVVNEDWATTWPIDSLRLALARADVVGECWVTPVDTPPAALATLDALLQAGSPAVPISPGGHAPGHPVLLDPALVLLIRRRPPAGGLRALLGAARRVPVGDPMVSDDFDDPAAWAAWITSG
jgi:CTP:molybdopterin cytidylyltransferase MocA